MMCLCKNNGAVCSVVGDFLFDSLLVGIGKVYVVL